MLYSLGALHLAAGRAGRGAARRWRRSRRACPTIARPTCCSRPRTTGRRRRSGATAHRDIAEKLRAEQQAREPGRRGRARRPRYRATVAAGKPRRLVSGIGADAGTLALRGVPWRGSGAPASRPAAAPPRAPRFERAGSRRPRPRARPAGSRKRSRQLPQALAPEAGLDRGRMGARHAPLRARPLRGGGPHFEPGGGRAAAGRPGARARGAMCGRGSRDYDKALADLAARAARRRQPRGRSDGRVPHGAALNRAGNPDAAFEILRVFAHQGRDNPPIIDAFGLSVLRLRPLPEELPPEKREMVLPRRPRRIPHGARAAHRRLAGSRSRSSSRATRPSRTCTTRSGTYLAPERARRGHRGVPPGAARAPDHHPSLLQIALIEIKRGRAGGGAAARGGRRSASPPTCPRAGWSLGRALLDAGETERAVAGAREGRGARAREPGHAVLPGARVPAGRAREQDAARARQEFLRLDRARQASGRRRHGSNRSRAGRPARPSNEGGSQIATAPTRPEPSFSLALAVSLVARPGPAGARAQQPPERSRRSSASQAAAVHARRRRARQEGPARPRPERGRLEVYEDGARQTIDSVPRGGRRPTAPAAAGAANPATAAARAGAPGGGCAVPRRRSRPARTSGGRSNAAGAAGDRVRVRPAVGERARDGQKAALTYTDRGYVGGRPRRRLRDRPRAAHAPAVHQRPRAAMRVALQHAGSPSATPRSRRSAAECAGAGSTRIEPRGQPLDSLAAAAREGRRHRGRSSSPSQQALNQALQLGMNRAFDALERDQQGFATTNGLLAVVTGLKALPGRKTVVFFSEGLAIPANVQAQFRSVIAIGEPRQREHLRDRRGRAARGERHARGARRDDPGRAAANPPGVAPAGTSAPDGAMNARAGAQRGPAAPQPRERPRPARRRDGRVPDPRRNDARAGFRRIAEDMRFHYVLSYSPTNDDTTAATAPSRSR